MTAAEGTTPPRLRILILSWRDEWHPEAGGSELTLGQVARGLAELGHRVTVATARYPGAAATHVDRGVTYVRRGGRLSVYAWGFARSLSRRFDVLLDVQNGIPFFSAALRPRSAALVVHHVHREQWGVAVGPIARRIGWGIESQISPRLHRRVSHVTVSQSTAKELSELGHPAHRIVVVHNGCDIPSVTVAKDADPRLIVVSRLVPHKRIERAIEAMPQLVARHEGIRLQVIGSGYHRRELEVLAASLGVDDAVDFLGHVPDDLRDELLARAWVNLLPSLKEGWGLVAMEAAACGTPTIAYAHAGGVTESVKDGVTGVLIGEADELWQAIDRLVSDQQALQAMSAACRVHAASFTWKSTVDGFEEVCLTLGRRARRD
jgi:glycosyltransferase involved in cell wall biosynthesis